MVRAPHPCQGPRGHLLRTLRGIKSGISWEVSDAVRKVRKKRESSKSVSRASLHSQRGEIREEGGPWTRRGPFPLHRWGRVAAAREQAAAGVAAHTASQDARGAGAHTWPQGGLHAGLHGGACRRSEGRQGGRRVCASSSGQRPRWALGARGPSLCGRGD